VVVISPRVADCLQIGLKKLSVLPILRAGLILRDIHKMQRETRNIFCTIRFSVRRTDFEIIAQKRVKKLDFFFTLCICFLNSLRCNRDNHALGKDKGLPVAFHGRHRGRVKV